MDSTVSEKGRLEGAENSLREISTCQRLMAGAIAERQVAIQVAATRERLAWFAPMLAASTIFLYKGYKVTGSPFLTFPLIPMGFALLYQVDFAYGTKMQRIKDSAENIMKNEAYLLTVPDLRPEGAQKGKALKTNVSPSAGVREWTSPFYS